MGEQISPVLSLVDVEKSFGDNQVLKGVSLNLYPGKVTAFLGANGAGKSTLIKVLAGLYPKSAGVVKVDGNAVEIQSPRDAGASGIQIVHQRVNESIVPGLTVAENLCFEEITSGQIHPLSRKSVICARALEICKALALEWDVEFLNRDVDDLGIADCQLLVLARALVREPKILILDEPTSTLSQGEVNRLFSVIAGLQRKNVAILYVSHRMGEIKQLADELVVLRDGRIVDHQESPFDLASAIDSMLGNKQGSSVSSIIDRRGDEISLELKGIKILPRSDLFDLQIRSGEVTGVVGLIGSGKTELAKGIYGLLPFSTGEMTLFGQVHEPKNPSESVAAGIYLVPEDRAAEAMLPSWSIADTVSLPFLGEVSKGGIVDVNKERKRGEQVIKELSVVTTGADQSVDALSGGNQQKVIVGRWLIGAPKVFILDEPFRGVDIGARRDISGQLRDLAETGTTVIVLSSDVDEIREVADRVLVLVDGVVRLDRYNGELEFNTIVESMSEVV